MVRREGTGPRERGIDRMYVIGSSAAPEETVLATQTQRSGYVGSTPGAGPGAGGNTGTMENCHPVDPIRRFRSAAGESLGAGDGREEQLPPNALVATLELPRREGVVQVDDPGHHPRGVGWVETDDPIELARDRR